MNKTNCVFCGSFETSFIFKDESRMQDARRYYHCKNCGLIFVHPDDRLEREEEFSRYERHENDPDDPQYRKFLSQLFEPVLERIKPGSFGLDFGSGPGPTLNLMFEERGHKMRIYDSFYARDESVFKEKYDFITSSETAEHLFEPLIEFDRLWDCLKPDGYLGVMTSQAPAIGEFKDWYYKNDDTHVIFFRPETFRWMAERWNAELEILSDTVIIFEKRGESLIVNC